MDARHDTDRTMDESSSRRQSIEEFGHEDRPRKRSKLGGFTENHSDVADAPTGRQGEIGRCLSRALNQTCSSLSELTSCSKPMKATSQQKQEHITHRFTYQRQEYDEGLYVFDKELPIEECMEESVRSATSNYNTGQVQLEQGKYAEASRLFELASLITKLNMTTYQVPQLALRIYHCMGYCYYRLGRNADSMRCYETALFLIHSLGLDEMDEAIFNNCIGVLLFHDESSENCDECLAFFEKTLKVYTKYLSADSPRLATVLNNIGRVHYLNGDYQDAITVYENALSIRRNKFGSNSIDVAATTCNTGQTYHQLGEFDKAMEHYEAFIQTVDCHLGPNHRDVAVVLKCMAEIHHKRGKTEKSKAFYERALRTARIALGKFHLDVAVTLNRLGNLCYEMKDLDGAQKYYLEGFKVEHVVLGDCHPHILVTLMNVAQICRCRGDFHTALHYYTEVHVRTLKGFGPNSLEVANTLSNLGLMQYQLSQYDAAFELYQEALRIQRDCYGSDDNVDVASTLNSVGLILFNKGVLDLAKDCFTDSLRIRHKILGPYHRDVAILWYNLATIHLEKGDDDLAIKMYLETLRIEKSVLGPKHPDVVLTLQHLGMVYQQRGVLDEALKHFGEALDIERTNGEANQLAVAKLLNLIGNIHLQLADVNEMMSCYAEASRIYHECGMPFDCLVIAGYNLYGLSKTHPPSAGMA